MPQGSNAVEIFDWYKENGLLDGMDDQQYHKLALAANAYEDKQLARIQASMDYSQMLQQDLMRKQCSVDASSYRLAELTHEMKYYALGGHNGVFDQYGKDPKVTLIPWRVQSDEGSKAKTPSLLEKFGNVQPGPWADGYVVRNTALKANPETSLKSVSPWGDVSTAAGYAGAYFTGLDELVTATGKSKAIGVLQNAGALWAGKQTQIARADGIKGAMGVSSATAKSTQQVARFATAAKMTGPLALAAGGVEVFADTMAAPEGQGIKHGVASAGALVVGTALTTGAYVLGTLAVTNPIGAVFVGGALAFSFAYSWNKGYGEYFGATPTKTFFRGLMID